MGRFLNEDTVEGQIDNPLTLNVYIYCYNNPLKFTDSSGNMPVNSLNSLSDGYNMGYMDARYVSSFTLTRNGFGVYTALHEIAQPNIAKKLNETGYDSTLEYQITSKTEKTWLGKPKKYEIDVVAGGQFWEVKPIIQQGKKQFLNKLINMMIIQNLVQVLY